MKKQVGVILLSTAMIASCAAALTACGDDKAKGFEETTVFHVDLSMSTAIGPLGTLCNPGTLTFNPDGTAKMNITFTDSAIVMMDTMLGFRIGNFVHNDTYELNDDKTTITYHSSRESSLNPGTLAFGDMDIEIEYLQDDSMKFVFDIGNVIPDTVLYFYSNEDMMPEWNPDGEDPEPEPEPETFDVSYSVGEGVTLEEDFTLPEKATYEEAIEITLPEAKFSKDKNIFRGWAINGKPYEYGEENIYQPGDKITVDYDAEIVAVWSDSIKVTYTKGENAKTSSAFIADMVAYYGYNTFFYFPANPYTYNGYDKGFAGWKEVGGTTVKQPGDSARYTEDKVFEPVWTEFVDVKFYLNSVDDENYYTVKVPLGAKFDLPDATVVGADSKVFAGWQQNGEGSAKKPTDKSVAVTKGLYYVAKTDSAVTISFDANGATGTTPAIVAGKGLYFYFPECGFTKDGYTFNGWGTSATQSYAGSMPGVRTSQSANKTYYAVWKQNRTVSFNTGLDGKTINPIVQGEGMTITLPAMPYENGTSVFDGWTDGSKVYAAGASYTVPNDADTELKAAWRKPVTVTFTGGEGATGSVEGINTYETKTIVFPANDFVMSGKLFIAWTDGENNYLPGDSYIVAEDVANGKLQFEAVWAEGTPYATDYTAVFRAGQTSVEVYKDADGKSVTLNNFFPSGSMTELVLRPDLTADFVVKSALTEKDFNTHNTAGDLGLTYEKFLATFNIEKKNISYDYDAATNKVTLNLGKGETLEIQLTKAVKNDTIGYDNVQFEYTLSNKVGAVEKLIFAAIDGEPSYLTEQKVFKGKTPAEAGGLLGNKEITLTVNTDGTGAMKVSIMTLNFTHQFTADYKKVIWLGDEGDRLEGDVGTNDDGKMTLSVTLLGYTIVLTEQ